MNTIQSTFRNYILISDASQEQVLQVVQDLADIYVDIEYSRGIQVYKHNKLENSFLIAFTKTPVFEHMLYSLNYLAFPEKVKYQAKVKGYCTMDIKVSNLNGIFGKRLMMFVSDKHKKYDNVLAVTEDNEAYKLGFALSSDFRKLPACEQPFLEQDFSPEEFTLLDQINPGPEAYEESVHAKLGYLPFLALVISGIICYIC
jgi:hypothetical protein